MNGNGGTVRTAAMLVAIGCGPGEPTESAVLLSGWSVAIADEEPFEGRPDELDCPDDVLETDFGYLEIDTDDCGWVTAIQPATRRSVEGDPIDFVVFHSALAVPGGGEAVANMYLTWGDELLWSKTLPIPSEDGVYAVLMEAPADLAEGDPIAFHVDNHGANSYRLAHLRVAPRR